MVPSLHLSQLGGSERHAAYAFVAQKPVRQEVCQVCADHSYACSHGDIVHPVGIMPYAEHLGARCGSISSYGNPGAYVAVFTAEDGCSHVGKGGMHGGQAVVVGAVGAYLVSCILEQLGQADGHSQRHAVGQDHASGSALRLHSARLHDPRGSQGREGQSVVSPTMVVLAERPRQSVEAAVGEGLDDASQRHEYALAVEAHLVADQAVLQERLLYDAVDHGVLAPCGRRCTQEQQQRKE